MSKNGILILCCLFIFSCHHDSSQGNSSLGKHHSPDDALEFVEEFEIEPPRTAEPIASNETSLEKGSKIIKNGNLKFEVDSLDVAKAKIDAILRACNGYYENEQYNSYSRTISYSLRLRIPTSRFDTLVKMLENGVGDLQSKNISAKDVTEEYVDLNIRLNNNIAYLNQYKEILRKAKSVKEILEVQEKIRRIEEEIESKKGRIKYLDDKVKYSTLNLELSEFIDTQDSNSPNFGKRILLAFNNGAQGFLNFLIGLIYVWPFLLLIILLLFGRKWIWKKVKGSQINDNK